VKLVVMQRMQRPVADSHASPLRLQALLQEERGDGAGGVAPGVLRDEAYRWRVAAALALPVVSVSLAFASAGM
jgi:hypothetical protein